MEHYAQARATVESVSKMANLFSFPNPVNEVSARLVAGGVVIMGIVAIALQQPWLMIVMAYGFVARVLTGPKLSPLGQLATRVMTPRLPFRARNVAGPPKRFAQGIGAAVTISAAVLYYGFHVTVWAYGLTGLLVVFATLESGFGFCVGCRIFAVLMRLNIIPEEVCRECANISLRSTSPSM